MERNKMLKTSIFEIVKRMFNNKIVNLNTFFVMIFILVILMSFTDVIISADKNKQQLSGLIVTDKQGKSYMVRQTIFGTFKINEFNVDKMRLIE
jgi:TM2 domain-containing membrane protein YozV